MNTRIGESMYSRACGEDNARVRGGKVGIYTDTRALTAKACQHFN